MAVSGAETNAAQMTGKIPPGHVVGRLETRARVIVPRDNPFILQLIRLSLGSLSN